MPAGVQKALADIEIGWQTDHEDLETCVGGLVTVGTLYEDDYAYIDDVLLARARAMADVDRQLELFDLLRDHGIQLATDNLLGNPLLALCLEAISQQSQAHILGYIGF